MSSHYGYGPVIGNYNGNDYRAMKTTWWDVSALASLNLTRLILGYEGMDSRKHLGQWMVNLGIGGTHHLGFANDYGSDNLWSGHAELQYSQFFNTKKRVSLDLKARGLFYQTNFDHESGMENRVAKKFDSNLGIHAGFTFYLGKARNNGWNTGATRIYQQDYREREIQVLKVKEQEVAKPKENTWANRSEQKRLSYKEQRELEQLNIDIEALNKEKAELDALFASGDTLDDVATKAARYQQVKDLLDEKELRWLELNEL
jgi:hypothetical protein